MTDFEKRPDQPPANQPPPADPPPPAYPPAPPGAVAPYAPGVLALPPGVELAGRGRRIGAFFLALPLMIVTLVVGYWIWGLVVWANGTTPALQVLGCRCVKRESGAPATWGTMALRNIVGRAIVESIAPVGIASFIIFLVNDSRQTLHDMIGGTLVVRDLR